MVVAFAGEASFALRRGVFEREPELNCPAAGVRNIG